MVSFGSHDSSYINRFCTNSMILVKKDNSLGFTLVEVLVVISIIGILSSIVMVSINSAKEKAEIAKGKAFDSHISRVIGLSLLSKWSLENGEAEDQAEGGNNGDITGGVTEVAGITDNALQFNGTDGLVEFDESFFVSTPTEFTVSLWAKPSSIPPDEDAVLFYSTRNVEFMIGYSTDGKFFTSYKLSSLIWEGVSAEKNSSPGKWYHVVASWSSSKVVLYVNGSVVGQIVPTGSTFATTPSGNPALAAFVRPTGTRNYFEGILDGVSLYTEAIP